MVVVRECALTLVEILVVVVALADVKLLVQAVVLEVALEAALEIVGEIAPVAA